MRKDILRITILVLGVAVRLQAQQQPLVSQYMLNNYFLNPAYKGAGEQFSFTIVHRTQWAGYQDYQGNTASQNLDFFNVSYNPDSTGHNIGLQLVQDKLGSLTSRSMQISYAYSVTLTKKSSLSIGFRGGIASKSIDFGEYVIMHPNDPIISEGKQSETKPDISLGLWFEHQRYYVGVSADGVVIQSDFKALGIENEKVLTVTAGYHFNINKDWRLTPSTQVISNTHHAFVDANVLLQNDNRFWAGFSYRHQEAAVILLGFGMIEQKLRLSYAYDYVTSSASIKSNSSHEIMLRYCTGRWHARKRIVE